MPPTVTDQKCARCGHYLTRRKYARKPTPHQSNPKTPEGMCAYCRDCYNIDLGRTP
jgi:hypothetical protein